MKRILFLIIALAATVGAWAEPGERAYVVVSPDSLTLDNKGRRPIISRDTIGGDRITKVVIDGDTAAVIMPNYYIGRYDRGLYNYLFIPKGQWAFGLTAAYGEYDADDVELLDILTDLDFKVKVYSLAPAVSYFVRNNQSLGVRFNYQRAEADLARMAFDFDDDINFDVRDVSYYSTSYGLSVFYRNYIGLSHMKRFGLFNEVELSFTSGSSRFKRLYDGEMRDTRTVSTGAALNFSPGLCMYIMDFVSFNVSFGVFGFHLSKDRQKTNDVEEGSRFSSGANFKFNLFNIKFGVSVNI